MKRAIRLWGIAAIGFLIVIVGVVYVTNQVLMNSVSERTNSHVTHSATDAMALDPRIVTGSAGPLYSMLALLAVNRALNAYPADFLRNRGPDILISNSLTLSGYAVAGTVQNYGDRGLVILSAGYLLPSFNLGYLQRTFHHEYSSLLMAAENFPRHEWMMLLPEEFTYPTSEQEQLEATQSYASAKDLSAITALGFVSDYGMSGIENDINTYAELLLSEPEKLINLSRSSPLVEQKTKLIVQFYARLHDGFTDYFSSSGLQQFL